MILVAIGANLPGTRGQSPLETCEWAVARLAALPGLSLQARSRWFRSAPVPPSGQPDYINGAARLWGRAGPHTLLAALHEIEAQAGRERGETNAARVLDLDLLAMNGVQIDDIGLVLPHPRLQHRGFVLAPLVDVAPDWVHPGLRRSAQSLLREADLSNVEPLPWADPAWETHLD